MSVAPSTSLIRHRAQRTRDRRLKEEEERHSEVLKNPPWCRSWPGPALNQFRPSPAPAPQQATHLRDYKRDMLRHTRHRWGRRVLNPHGRCHYRGEYSPDLAWQLSRQIDMIRPYDVRKSAALLGLAQMEGVGLFFNDLWQSWALDEEGSRGSPSIVERDLAREIGAPLRELYRF